MFVVQVCFFEGGVFIVDLDDVCVGRVVYGEDGVVVDWFCCEDCVWVLVLLFYFEWLIGVVVFVVLFWQCKFDWEDFDLLCVVGQQFVSYFVEQVGQYVLEEVSCFDDFYCCIVFVMYDIKNLVSQFGLFVCNVELYVDKFVFCDDMLLMLCNLVDKFNVLFVWFLCYGGGQVQQFVVFDGGVVVCVVVE